MIIGVIDKEPVVDGLLQTLCLVTGGDKGTRLSGSCTLFYTGSLGEGFIVSLHSVNNNSPLPIGVNSTEWLNISSHRGTQVGLLYNLLQAVNTVLGISEHVLIDSLHSFVVILKSVLYLIGGVLGVFQAPSFGVVNRALWGLVMIGFWLMVRSRSMMNWSVMNNCMMNWSCMMNGATMVDKSSRVSRGRSSMVDWFRTGVVYWFRSRVVDRGSVVNWLYWAISGGGGVTIHRFIGKHRGSGHRGKDNKLEHHL